MRLIALCGFVVLLTSNSIAQAADVDALLRKEAKSIAASSKNAAFEFVAIQRTMTEPFTAYSIEFLSNSQEMRLKENAKPGTKEYITNSGLQQVWQTAFCSSEMKYIARTHKLMINGTLISKSGKKEFFATCAYYD